MRADPDVKEEKKIGHVAKVKKIAASKHGNFSIRKVTMARVTDVCWCLLTHSAWQADKTTACRADFLHVEPAALQMQTATPVAAHNTQSTKPIGESGSHDESCGIAPGRTA